MDQSHHLQLENHQCQSNHIQSPGATDADKPEPKLWISSSLFLGLKLTITQELVDLCSNVLHSKRKQKVHNDGPSASEQRKRRGHVRVSKAQAAFDKERQKACNFSARQITIGNWKFTTKREGDFMVKLYFCKRKLVWEFLVGGLKKKMELPWSGIAAIKAVFGKSGQGDSLYVKFCQSPVFSREVDPKPRKHTNWEPYGDFTGGEASAISTHHVLFAPGSLREPYKRLMQADERLCKLDQEPYQRDNAWSLEDNNYPARQENILNHKRVPAPVPNLLPEYHNATYNQFPLPERTQFFAGLAEQRRQNSIWNERVELNTQGTTQDQLNMPLSYMNSSFSHASNHQDQGYMVRQGNNIDTMTRQDYQYHSQGQFNNNLMQSSQFEHHSERSREPPHDDAKMNNGNNNYMNDDFTFPFPFPNDVGHPQDLEQRTNWLVDNNLPPLPPSLLPGKPL